MIDREETITAPDGKEYPIRDNEQKIMKQNYYIELHAVGKKETTGWNGFDECCAHFSSTHKPATPEFVADMKKAIDFRWNQEKRYWLDYAVGKLFVQAGHEEVTAMCPSYFEGYRSRPVYEKVK